jgi:hypothetical protein
MPRTRLLRHVVFLHIVAFVAFSRIALPTMLASFDRFGQSADAVANAPSRGGDTSDATASPTPDPPPVAPLYLAGRPW